MNTEKPDYEIARDELNALFDSLGLKAVVSEPIGTAKDNWPGISYRISIKGEVFEYSLGIGHVDWQTPYKRVKNDGEYLFRLRAYSKLLDHEDARTIEVHCTGKKFTENNEKRLAECAAKLAKIQKKEPNPAEVLACHCREGMDADQSFEHWCADFGYNTDSRKAEEIYRACTENGKKARRILSAENFAKFAELSSRL